MKTALVGHTGFVGGNLAAAHRFDALYNSKNIAQAYGTKPELLVYSGVRAEMFLANTNPQADLEAIIQAFDNIRRIAPRRVVLISTISVYPDPRGADETTAIDPEGLPAYGANRRRLEQMVRQAFPEALTVRLPALFGPGLKKNFIYDMLHPVPAMLRPAKHAELLGGTEFAGAYELQSNGFMRLTATDPTLLGRLLRHLQGRGFTALNFTDSRSRYQFFNLANLWGCIETALGAGLKLLNITSEPVTAAELYRHIHGRDFVNEVNPNHPDQDLRTVHAELFGGSDGYLYPRQAILGEIKKFVLQQ